MTRQGRGGGRWLEAEAECENNVNAYYMRHYVDKNWQLKIVSVFFIKSYCSCFMHVNAKQSIGMQLVFINLVFLVDTLRISSSTCAIVLQLSEAEAVTTRRGKAEAEETRPRH